MPDDLQQQIQSLQAGLAGSPLARAAGVERPELPSLEGQWANRVLISSGGLPDWSNQEIPLQERTKSFVSTNLKAGRPWDEVAPDAQKHLGIDPRQIKGPYKLEEARNRAAEEEIPWAVAIGRHFPAAGTAGKLLLEREYGIASRRIAAGAGREKGQDGAAYSDYDLVAQYERLQQIDRQRSLLGTAAQAAAELPALALETAAGGGALRGVKIAARGLKAQAAVEGTTSAALGRGTANAFARGTADVVARTAASPLFYAEEAQKNLNEAAAQGKTALSDQVRAVGAAFAYGAFQNAIVGQIFKPATGSRVGAVLKKTPLGMFEQQAVDSVAGWTDVKTGYGAFGDLARGKTDEGLKAAVSQVVTFGALAGFHGKSPDRLMKAAAESIDQMHADGATRAEAGAAVQEAVDRVKTVFEKNPQATPADVKETLGDLAADDPIRKAAEVFAGAAAEKPTEAPPQEPQEPPGEAKPAPPADPYAALDEAAVRALAREKGFPVRGGRETIIRGILARPSGRAVLDYAVRQKTAPPEPAKPPVEAPPETTLPQKGAAPAAGAAPGEGVTPPGEVANAPRGAHLGGPAERSAAVADAIERVGRGEKAVYVDMDADNLKGLVGAAGEGPALAHVREMVGIVHEELSRVGEAKVFRHAGDPKGDEHSAVVLGADRAQVNEALARAAGRIEALVRQRGWADVPRPEGAKPGPDLPGLTTFAEQLKKGEGAGALYARTENGTENAKVNPRLRPGYEPPRAAYVSEGESPAEAAGLGRGRGHLAGEEVPGEDQIGGEPAEPGGPPADPYSPEALRAAGLSDQEATIVRGREVDDESQAALGRRLGLSGERVRQVEAVARAKLGKAGSTAAAQKAAGAENLAAIRDRQSPETVTAEGVRVRAVVNAAAEGLRETGASTVGEADAGAVDAEAGRQIRADAADEQALGKLQKELRTEIKNAKREGREPNPELVADVRRRADEIHSRRRGEAAKPAGEAGEVPGPTEGAVPAPAPGGTAAGQPAPLRRGGPAEPGPVAAGPAAAPAEAARGQGPGRPAAGGGPAAGDQLAGHATTIAVAGAAPVPARYEVRDLGAVRASHEAVGPENLRDRVRPGEYPEGLQPRDYDAAGEKNKVWDNARRLEPRYLISGHPDATSGPPAITEGGVVLNGNGRQMTLEAARLAGTYAQYKAELVARAAEFGLDPAKVAAMDSPALYRVVGLDPGSAAAREFARRGNVTTTQAQSPARTAAALADLIDEGTLGRLKLTGDETFSRAVNDPSAGRPFRAALHDRLPPSVRDQYFEPGRDRLLTEAGKELVEQMLVSKILPVRLAEELSRDRRQALRAVEGAVPQVLALRVKFPDRDPTPQLTEALEFLARNPRVQSAADAANALDQLDLFSGRPTESISPGGRMMLDFVLENAGRVRVFREKLAAMVRGEDASRGRLFSVAGEGVRADPVENAAANLGVKYRPGAAFGPTDPAAIRAAITQLEGEKNGAVQQAVRSGAPIAPVSQAVSLGDAIGQAQGAAEGRGADEAGAGPGTAGAAAGAGPEPGRKGGFDPGAGPGGAGDRPPVAGRLTAAEAEDQVARDLLRGEEPRGTTAVPAPGRPGAPPQEASALQAAREGVKTAVRAVIDNWYELAGRSAPRTTRLSESSGNTLARLSSAEEHAKRLAPVLAEEVLGPVREQARREAAGSGVAYQEVRFERLARRLMATGYEERLRHTREARRRQSLELADEAYHLRGTDEPAARAKFNESLARAQEAREVRTVLGRDGTDLNSEADYQRSLASPEYRAFKARWQAGVAPVTERAYRDAQGLGDAEEIESLTQLPDFTFNAKAVRAGDAVPDGAAVVVPGAQGRLGNVRATRNPFSREFTGAAEGYDVDPRAVIVNSLSKSFRVAAKARMYRQFVADGIAAWAAPGARPPGEGWRKLPEVKPPPGTQEAQRGRGDLWVHPDAYGETVKALDLVDPYKKLPGAEKATNVALLALVEALTHAKNLGTFVFKPGVNPIEVLRNFRRVVAGDPEARRRIAELAELGATKPEGLESAEGAERTPLTANPLSWLKKGREYMSRALDTIDLTMRLTADAAFDTLARRGTWGVKETEQNRRDFVNQLGLYHKRVQNDLVRALKQTGVGPFAVAAFNYTAQGFRQVAGLSPGVTAKGWKGDALMRAESFLKVALAASVAPVLNYIMWGRADGDDKTPLGGLKVRDKDGKTGYLDLFAFTGVPRGLRSAGALAMIEGQRAGTPSGESAKRGREDVFHGLAHPFLGPYGSAGLSLLTGRNAIGMPVAPKAKPGDTVPNQVLLDTLYTLANVNPVLSALSGMDRPTQKGSSTEERAMRLLGPFGVKYRGSPPGRVVPERR